MKQMSLDIAHSFCTYLHFWIICSIELYLELKSSIFQLENERKSLKYQHLLCFRWPSSPCGCSPFARRRCFPVFSWEWSIGEWFKLLLSRHYFFFSFSHLFLPFSNKLVEFDWFVILRKCFFFFDDIIDNSLSLPVK